MKYKDFFKHLEYTEEAKALIEEYFTEPVAYRMKSEPGWKIITLGPTDNKYEVEVDFIDIEEWVIFTSLRYLDLPREEIMKRALINSQLEQSIPRIPESYNGKLKEFFDSIQEEFPNWNRVTFPSLIIGCVGPNDVKDFDALEQKAKDIWRASRKHLDEEEKIIKKMTEAIGSKGGLQSIIDGLLGPKIEKSKLN